MNLQRREEIRKMCAEPARGGTQGAKQIFDLRDAVNELFAHIDTLEQAAAERVIADGKAWAVVVPELPTWEDGENKLRRGEKLTALEKFVIDHDWHKTDTTFRDGLEAVFAELRANQGGADNARV